MSNIFILEVNFDFNGASNTLYPVILKDEEHMVLIDAGYPEQLDLFKVAANRKGLKLDNLTHILITHQDHDHIGSLAQFKREYPDIQILCSDFEADYISGKKKFLRLQQAEALYDQLPEDEKPGALAFQQLLESVKNVDVDSTLRNGDILPYCGGIRIVETPGHMPGHISFYIESSKTLIVGDALVVMEGKLAIPYPQYCFDMEQAKNSALKLLQYDINRIVCYHGGFFKGDCKKALEEAIN